MPRLLRLGVTSQVHLILGEWEYKIGGERDKRERGERERYKRERGERERGREKEKEKKIPRLKAPETLEAQKAVQ